jgi:hypothetical protein
MSDAYNATVPPPGWENTAQDFQRKGVSPEDAQRLGLAYQLMQKGYKPQDALMLAARLIQEQLGGRRQPLGTRGQGGTMAAPGQAASGQMSPMQMAQAAKGFQGLLGGQQPGNLTPQGAPVDINFDASGGLPAGWTNVGGL